MELAGGWGEPQGAVANDVLVGHALGELLKSDAAASGLLRPATRARIWAVMAGRHSSRPMLQTFRQPPPTLDRHRIFLPVRERLQDAIRVALEQPDDELVAGGHAKRVC